jgi:hypothetical protein
MNDGVKDTARRLATTTGFTYDNLLRAGELLVGHGLTEEQAAHQVEQMADAAPSYGLTPLHFAWMIVEATPKDTV